FMGEKPPGNNRCILFHFDQKFWDKAIYDKHVDNPDKMIWSSPCGIQMTTGTPSTPPSVAPARPIFDARLSPTYKLATLQQWWNDPYYIDFGERYSKSEIFEGLQLDGASHVVPLPSKYVMLKNQKSLQAGFIGDNPLPLKDIDVVRFIVGASAVEFLDYLDRNFVAVVTPPPTTVP